MYAAALADPDYRKHRTESVANASIDDLEHPDTSLLVPLPDGSTRHEVDMLLIANNPYQFIGPPDFAGRSALDGGILEIIVADRSADGVDSPPREHIERWTTSGITVSSTTPAIGVGVDGSLHRFDAPVDVSIVPGALRVVLPREVVERELAHDDRHLTTDALVHLAGVSGDGDRD